MAFDFSKLNFFSRLEARDRMFVLLGGVLGIIGLIYLVTVYFSSESATVGPSQVANAPRGLQSIPGGQLTAEYSRALQQANSQSAQAAQMTGTSAVPTLMNYGDAPQAGGTANCVVCTDKNENVKYSLDEWVRKGIVEPGVATELQQMANRRAPLSEFEIALNRLIKEGKLTPEQARELLDRYKKQYQNNLLDESAVAMDQMIKSGSLPLDAATQLLSAQKDKVSPGEYSARVDKLVADGKISPEIGRQIVSQYNQQLTKEITNERISTIHEMARNGQLIPEVENKLVELEKNNAPLDQYTAEVQKFVADGKLTPAVADKLISGYRDQRINAMGSEVSADQRLQRSEQRVYNSIDELVKANRISSETGQVLSNMVRRNTSAEEYESTVRNLVKQGKIPPDVAEARINEYNELKKLRDSTNMADSNSAIVKKMEDRIFSDFDQQVKDGKISSQTAQELANLIKKNVSVDEYANAVQKLVNEGKLPPELAEAKKNEYRTLKALRDTPDSLQMIRQAEEDTYRGFDTMVKAGKISPETGQALSDLVQRNPSTVEFKEMVAAMVAKGLIPADAAKAIIAQYEKVKQLRDMRDALQNLQANNVPEGQYRDELKKWVAKGAVTPAQAAALMSDYQTAKQNAQLAQAQAAPASTARTSAFAELEARTAKLNAASAPVQSPESVLNQFGSPEQQAAAVQVTQTPEQQQAMAAAQEAQTAAMMGAMQSQAAQLIASWQPPVMTHTQGQVEVVKTKTGPDGSSPPIGGSGPPGTNGKGGQVAPLLKAGTIAFGVLDTEANSDYPDSPIMATIVEGPLKNAKLMGKLVTTKSVSGQMDRISLNFTLMNMDAWTNSKAITAYAVDPDTARTALATHVDYHYLQKFGAMMATSFLTGYASAITQAGTSTTGIFGTSTTHPELSPSQKIFTALGQMGTTLGAATQNYINIPPTVKVEAGVGIGVLFMADVTA